MLVAGCWGLNFPATAIALEHFPPLLMVALRFGLVAIPAVALVPRPNVKWRWLLGTGLGLGTLQFAFLYLGMAAGMPSGLASLVLQASAPFTLLLAGVWLGERLTSRQALSTLIAMAGLTAIAIHRGQNAALLPMVLTLCGALGWAIGNVCSRRAQAPNPLHLTLWMSVVPPIPLLVASLIFEGPPRIHSVLLGLTSLRALPSVLGLIYIVVVGHPDRLWPVEHTPRALPLEYGRAVLDAGSRSGRRELLVAVRRAARHRRAGSRCGGDRWRASGVAHRWPGTSRQDHLSETGAETGTTCRRRPLATADPGPGGPSSARRGLTIFDQLSSVIGRAGPSRHLRTAPCNCTTLLDAGEDAFDAEARLALIGHNLTEHLESGCEPARRRSVDSR